MIWLPRWQDVVVLRTVPGAWKLFSWGVHAQLPLKGLARRWMLSGNIRPADAIVMLGGALDVRPAAAAALPKRRHGSVHSRFEIRR
jgi:hypothetical protein